MRQGYGRYAVAPAGQVLEPWTSYARHNLLPQQSRVVASRQQVLPTQTTGAPTASPGSVFNPYTLFSQGSQGGFYGPGPAPTGGLNGPAPQPLIALGRMHITCAQWTALSPAWKASLVRGVLEGLGFASLNSANRGNIVYTLVGQIDKYCEQQASIAANKAVIAAGQVAYNNAPQRSSKFGFNMMDGIRIPVR